MFLFRIFTSMLTGSSVLPMISPKEVSMSSFSVSNSMFLDTHLNDTEGSLLSTDSFSFTCVGSM